MDQTPNFPVFPMHFRGLLMLSGIYTIAWSAFFKWFGTPLLYWLAKGDEVITAIPPSYYGTFGLIVGLVIFFGSFYPVSWMYLILGGIAGKVILALCFIFGFLPDLGWNKRTGFHLIFNELLWIIPLTVIYLRAKKVKIFLDSQPDPL